MYYRLGANTETTQKFWGHDETSAGGVLGVFVDGALTEGDTLSASNDYCGVVEVTVSSGTHTYQMALDGVAVEDSGTFQTAPSSGEDFDLMFSGDGRLLNPVLHKIIDRENLRGHWGIEWHYIEGYYTVTGPDYLSQYRAGYADIFATEKRGRQHFFKTVPTRLMWDNHEVGPGAAWPVPGTDAFDQPEQAANEWLFAGNPDNTDSPIDTGAHYFAETVGDVEVIQLDGSTYSATSAAGTIENASRGGDYQANWCADRITNSTANVIILLPCKEFSYGDTASWDIIIAAINASNKTIFMIEFDSHAPYARVTDRGPLTSPILSVGGGAIMQATTKTLTKTHPNDTWYFCFDASTGTYDLFVNDDLHLNQDNLNIAYVVVKRIASENRTRIEIKNSYTGQVIWYCDLTDGSLTPVVPVEIAQGLIR